MFEKNERKFSTGRAPKKLVAGKFHTGSSKPSRTKEQPVAQARPIRRALTLDEKKQQLTAWAENEKIPGKIQAWFTKDAQSDHSDWRILNKLVDGHESISLESPAKDMPAPECVQKILEQLHKEHLRPFKRALRQIWFRATGDGRFAMLIQANLHGSTTAHASKTFLEFVERFHPEIISCHQLRCTPNYLFDPTKPLNMRVEAKAVFGSDFMPLSSTGLSMHVLDWAPKIKDAWLEFPQRIRDAIHPAPGDKFFEFFSGSSFVSASLSNDFERIDALDCRETAMLSTKHNARTLLEDNLRFHRAHLEPAFLEKFFSKDENEGRWTFYLNTGSDTTFNAELAQAIASSRPERILLQTSDLENAAKEIKRFRDKGYMLRKTIPLDLEPGTAGFEILMLFVPDRVGLLGGFGAKKAGKRPVQRPVERVTPQNRGDIPHFVQKSSPRRQRKD